MAIQKGAVTAVLGSNASGKTTFLKCLGRQYVCDKGHGTFPEENGQLRVGFVYDECPYPGTFTVQRLSKVMSDLYPDWDRNCFSDMCPRFGLNDGQRIGEMSKGSKMKLQAAVNLSHKVDLLLLDEFTVGLDDRSKRCVMGAVKSALDEDVAVVMSTNDTSDLERFADRIVILRDGKVVLDTDVPTLQDSFMIIRSTDPNITISADDLVNVRKEGYGSAYLVRSNGRIPETVGNTVVERASVREILAFYTEDRGHE
jgi:ABC-2 type transport system ATP-binding protein